MKVKHDGRLAPAYFSANYKYFDQFLQTITNQTTVLNLLFKSFFTNINSSTDFHTLRKGEGSRLALKVFLSHSAKKLRRGTIRCFRKVVVSKTFTHMKGGGGGSITTFRQKILSLRAKNFCWGTI